MDTAEIKKIITDDFLARQEVRELYDIEQEIADGAAWDDLFSTASVENLLFYSTAAALKVLSDMFDQHRADIAETLASQRAGTAEWYAWKVKQFRLGQALIDGTDQYSDEGLTEEEIAAARIVTKSAAVEAKDSSILYIKVAKGDDGNLQPLTSTEQAALEAYIHKISYAGVRWLLINDQADRMRLTIDIYYDAQILDADGRRLDGTDDSPVQNAIRDYLKNLPFNSMYTNQALIDRLQDTEGVVIGELKQAEARYGGYVQWHAIDARETAHAGYYTIADEDLHLRFTPN